MPGTLDHRARAVMALLLAVSLVGLARPAPAAAAVAMDQQSLDNGTRLGWPAMAQTVTADLGGLLGVGISLSRTTADTQPFSVEIRTVRGGIPTGSRTAGTGVVLASATVDPAAISTNPLSPSWTWLSLDQAPMIGGAGSTFAIVVLRGADAGLSWHASAPDVDAYTRGAAWFCGAVACWSARSELGTHDFAFQTSISSGSGVVPPGSPPPDPIANVVGPSSPTNAATNRYAVSFLHPVTGLAAADFVTSGTATGCVVGTPSGSGTSYSVPVTHCSQGTLALTLKADSVVEATDATVLGPTNAVRSPATLVIDRTAPTAGAPRATLRAGVALSGARLPVHLAWTGGDTGGSGFSHFELARSTNGGATWTSLGRLTAASLNVSLASGGTLRYRVRSVDLAGNVSAWKSGPGLVPRLVQQSSGGIAYTGPWATRTSALFSGATARTASHAGASARYTFTGRSAAIVMTKAPTVGRVRVYVNGVLADTVDTWSTARSDRVLAWAHTWGASATRTVRIVVEGTAGRPAILFDAIARL